MTDVELIHGDCLEVMLTLPKGSVDMVLCDPPYGMFSKTTTWDTALPFDEMWACLEWVCKPNAAIVLFGVEPFASRMRLSVDSVDNPFEYKYDVIWDKGMGGNFASVKYRPFNEFENMMLFCNGKGKVYYEAQLIKRTEKSLLCDPPTDSGSSRDVKAYDGSDSVLGMNPKLTKDFLPDGMRQPRNIVKFMMMEKGVERGLHPTQKPIKLLMNRIKTYSKEGETILDFTAGSGSTGVACVKTKRHFIGIEKDSKFMNVMRDRLAKPIEVELC